MSPAKSVPELAEVEVVVVEVEVAVEFEELCFQLVLGTWAEPRNM
jgi:hypothetical protein